MGAAMKDCPVSGCAARIANELILCHVHWALVPENIRRRLRTLRDGATMAEAVQLVEERKLFLTGRRAA